MKPFKKQFMTKSQDRKDHAKLDFQM